MIDNYTSYHIPFCEAKYIAVNQVNYLSFSFLFYHFFIYSSIITRL